MENKILFNARLRMIGFRISIPNSEKFTGTFTSSDCDIEETLIECLYEARDDNRLLKILLDWIRTHGEHVILEKFFKKLKDWEKHRGKTLLLELLIGVAIVSGHKKWKRHLKTNPAKPIYPYDEVLSKSSISVKGKNQELAKLGILVSSNFLDSKKNDVLSVEELIKTNIQYKNRFLFGPNFRADILSAIETGAENRFRISKSLSCSYESVHRIFKEYNLWKTADSKA